MINVLFVCLGNICRSPMAEAVFKHLVAQEGLNAQFSIDSVGTGAYHTGEPVHHGTRRVLADHNIPCNNRASQLTRADLKRADYIIVMDHHNLSDVQHMARGSSLDNRLHLLLDFANNTHLKEVPDPYYTSTFEEVYSLVKDGCQGLLAHIQEEQGG